MTKMTDAPTHFEEVCRSATEAFLQTVMVIDNQAIVRRPAPPKEETKRAKTRRNSAPGPQKAPENNTPESARSEGAERIEHDDPHDLNLNEVARAFARHGLTCGVYLPNHEDPEDDAALIKQTVHAILPTDACVLDWQLRRDEPEPAIEAIKEVLREDDRGGGRLRLILIYTAEELDGASKELEAALKEEGRDVLLDRDEDVPVIVSEHLRIAFANKPTRGRNPEIDHGVVGWSDLPDRILREFTKLSRGLLRAFALHSVAAVRRDMHRILAQFDPDLDPVYAGDRATKPDQSDAVDLMVDLLNSELAHTVNHSEEAQSCLTESGVLAWLTTRNSENAFRDIGRGFTAGGTQYERLDHNARTDFLKERPPVAIWIKKKEQMTMIQKHFFSGDEIAENASARFAALSTFSRTATHKLAPTQKVKLGFGSLIVRGVDIDEPPLSEQDVFVCLQPACDATRIDVERPFLLVRLVADDGQFRLTLQGDKTFSRWRLPNKNERHLVTIPFPPSQGVDGVWAKRCEESGASYFEDTEGVKWRWLADLRDLTAVSIRDEALQPLAGVGLNGLEWLRLKSLRP